MEVIEENAVNYLVLTDDGRTTTKTKDSNLNKLLFGHNLHGFLQSGEEVWMSNGATDDPKVTVIPDDNAECYTIRVEEAGDLTLDKKRKTDLVDAMAKVYEEHDGKTTKPILDLYNRVRENMVRADLLDNFAELLSEKVVVRDDGWFINGHLLLSYEGDFSHPNTESMKRSGQQTLPIGASVSAYNLNVDAADTDMERSISFDGENYWLTNGEVEFLAKGMWAIEKTPDKRDN